ncbi:pyrBI operon leader peptide [Enterobacteriaceae bacterium 4M9]|nr:pyrBI operon leader peptide [Enterobacteriaceae bacterium 4M9]
MSGMRIIPDNLPGGSMVLRAGQHVTPHRLNTGAGLPFFALPPLFISKKPLIEGLFFVRNRPGGARTGEHNG